MEKNSSPIGQCISMEQRSEYPILKLCIILNRSIMSSFEWKETELDNIGSNSFRYIYRNSWKKKLIISLQEGTGMQRRVLVGSGMK